MKQKKNRFAWWNIYQRNVRGIILPNDEDSLSNISYWRNEIFVSIIIYITPLSIIALIPGVIVSFQKGLPIVGFVDLAAFLVLIVIMVKQGLPLWLRKFIFIVTLYFLSVMLIYYVGKGGPGLLFLLVITVLCSIIYSPAAGYNSAWINTFICIAFGILGYFNAEMAIIIDYAPGTWIAVTSNLVLLSFACAKCLDLLLEGLTTSLNERKNALSGLQKIVNSSLDIICSIDEEGRFVAVSAAAEHILGYDPNELIGKKYIDMVYTEDLKETIDTSVKVMSGTPLTFFENRYLHKNGKIVPIIWSATWDSNDKLMYCIAKDDTERKKIEHQLSLSEKSNREVLVDLTIASKELIFRTEEKVKRAAELIIANNELLYQNNEKEKRAIELILANKELMYQNEEKENRAAELVIANKELIYQNGEKENRAAELIIANEELNYQSNEKGKRAAELIVANQELVRAKHLKEFAKNNLKALINSTNDLMWSVDRKFRLITSNEPFDKLVKNISGQDIQKGDNALSITGLSSGNLSRYKGYYMRAFAGESFTETEYTEGPLSLYAEISFHPIRKGDEIIGTACHSHDITERKIAEEEKIKMSEDLIQRSKNLEQFAYIVSHNLRAPVANIMGLSKVLKSNISTTDRKQTQEFLFAATEQLDEIIKDLNTILQIRSEINEYKEAISLPDLVISIKSVIHNLIQKDEVEIVTDFNAMEQITSIKSYINSIFYNLISNSIKYRNADKSPVINIRSEISNGKIKIFFKDNGLGIDLTKNGDKVFGLYKRFHLHIEGKGLGLFMIKTQVETLGGNIQIESTPEVGTEFIIELPL